MGHEKVVQQRPPHAPVSIRERMNVLKAHMKICTELQCILARKLAKCFNQLRHIFLDIFRQGTDFLNACHIIVLLKFAGTLASFDITGFVVCSACQNCVYFLDKLNSDRFAENELGF